MERGRDVPGAFARRKNRRQGRTERGQPYLASVGCAGNKNNQRKGGSATVVPSDDER